MLQHYTKISNYIHNKEYMFMEDMKLALLEF